MLAFVGKSVLAALLNAVFGKANFNPLTPVFTLFSHRNNIIFRGTLKHHLASKC